MDAPADSKTVQPHGVVHSLPSQPSECASSDDSDAPQIGQYVTLLSSNADQPRVVIKPNRRSGAKPPLGAITDNMWVPRVPAEGVCALHSLIWFLMGSEAFCWAERGSDSWPTDPELRAQEAKSVSELVQVRGSPARDLFPRARWDRCQA